MTDEREQLPSASGLERMARCPGSWAAEQGMPDLPTQQVTQEGTDIHAALETGDDDDLAVDEKEIKQRLAKMEQSEVAKWADTVPFPLTLEPIRERRLWIRDSSSLEKIASAKLDVSYVIVNHGLIIDFKSGFNDPTPSERNWQLRTQVVALRQAYPSLTKIRAAFAVSRLSSVFDSTDYDTEDIDRIEREIRHVLWQVKQPDAPRVPGPHCHWCRAQGSCREAGVYTQIAEAQLPAEANELDVIQAVSRMTPGELARVYERRSVIKSILTSVEYRLKSLPPGDLSAVGYELRPGNKGVDITDISGAFMALKDLVGDARMVCVDLVLGRAEDIMVESGKATSKKEAKEKIRSALAPYLKEKTGQPRLKAL